MKYVPLLMSFEGEIKALKNQKFSSEVIPLIQIVKDKRTETAKKGMLDDIQSLIELKPDNNFFITIPRNLELSKKKLKPTVQRFFQEMERHSSYNAILERFNKYPNVIPVLEVNIDKYVGGELRKLKEKFSENSNIFCYRVDAKNFKYIKEELSELISNKDYLMYDLNSSNFNKKSVINEIKEINQLKKRIKFKSIVIKQIYDDLTFFKYPDREIKENDEAYECIDLDYFDDYSEYDFDIYGDWAGIRNNPIYDGGSSYPTYLTTEMDTFNHHGFKGNPRDITSYEKVVLPKYLSSEHWNDLINSKHKEKCYGCSYIKKFKEGTEKANDATKWKCITISHFISTMDYKINHIIE